jgi:hypothetical protein
VVGKEAMLKEAEVQRKATAKLIYLQTIKQNKIQKLQARMEEVAALVGGYMYIYILRRNCISLSLSLSLSHTHTHTHAYTHTHTHTQATTGSTRCLSSAS